MQRKVRTSTPRKQPIEKPPVHYSIGGTRCFASPPARHADWHARIGRQDRGCGVSPKIGRLLAPMGSFHELAPYFDRKPPAGDSFGWRVVVVAEPDARHQLVREAYEPCITEILAGAGLAGDRPAW